MWRYAVLLNVCLVAVPGSPTAAGEPDAEHSFPAVKLSNGLVEMSLYLPDPEKGYYRGTRFDWSGVVSRLTYRGHNYFGEWKDVHDPNNHDDICGPVEAFQTDGAGLGYAEAKPGGTFVKIGVGVLERPDDSPYRWNHTYKIVDPGKWTVAKGRQWIQFRHDLSSPQGWQYAYTKRIDLTRDPPGFTIAHTLENTGSKTIETDQYNHNFFVIDGRPSGPEFIVRFPFAVKATGDLGGFMETAGKELRYLKELGDDRQQSVFTTLEGFQPDARHHEIVVENHRTGAGVKVTADKPLSELNFWCIRRTLCPENFVHLSITPGKQERWITSYVLRTFAASSK